MFKHLRGCQALFRIDDQQTANEILCCVAYTRPNARFKLKNSAPGVSKSAKQRRARARAQALAYRKVACLYARIKRFGWTGERQATAEKHAEDAAERPAICRAIICAAGHHL